MQDRSRVFINTVRLRLVAAEFLCTRCSQTGDAVREIAIHHASLNRLCFINFQRTAAGDCGGQLIKFFNVPVLDAEIYIQTARIFFFFELLEIHYYFQFSCYRHIS